MVPSTNNPIPAPVRLAPIIRAPDREEAASNHARPGQRTKHLARSEPESVFTVFVNSAVCPHSVSLMNDIRNVHRIPCTVIDVADGKNVPPWLYGTPSIVVGTDVYCGDTAFDFVASMASSVNQRQGSKGSDNLHAPSFQDIVAGKAAQKERGDGIGCGLTNAFSPPVQISEEEAQRKHSGSVDDAMAKLMQARK